jgi:quercetin dioxygenase-like cupin family protein
MKENMTIIKKAELLEKYFLPKISGKSFHSENNTFSFTHFRSGASSPRHKHPVEEVLLIMEGGGEFMVDNVTHMVEAGDVVIIPPMVLHQFNATLDTHAIEIFQPKLSPQIMAMMMGDKFKPAPDAASND